MHQRKKYCLLLLVVLSKVVCAQETLTMLDRSLGKPGEEWSYLAKFTTVIAVPFQPDVIQVTYDGALFTRNAESCFFFRKNDKPIMSRAKTF